MYDELDAYKQHENEMNKQYRTTREYVNEIWEIYIMNRRILYKKYMKIISVREWKGIWIPPKMHEWKVKWNNDASRT